MDKGEQPLLPYGSTYLLKSNWTVPQKRGMWLDGLDRWFLVVIRPGLQGTPGRRGSIQQEENND